MKKIVAFFLVFNFIIQSTTVFAAENKKVENFTTQVKRQSKDQYPYKKVLKKYDPYLLTITNNGNKPILITTDSVFEFEVKNGEVLTSEMRRDIYRKTRHKDVGKYSAIAMPCSAIAGAVIGFTFGLGIPVGIGIILLGSQPATKATATNSEITKDLYDTRKIPLRFEPKETYLVRILVPKETSINSIILTNLTDENNSERLDLEIGVNNL